MLISSNGVTRQAKILHLLPVNPHEEWKAVFSNPDAGRGEGARSDYRTMPLVMWAAIEIQPEGDHQVVGLVGNLCQLEPPHDDTFLG